MYIVFIFLILVYFNGETVSRDIEVLNSGVMKIRQDDMIVVFFVTIHHHGEKARNVMATMIECCEKITDDDVDCDLIEIHGEYLGIIEPGTSRNLTFIYPNVYGYNRRGYCTVGIWNRKDGEPEDSHEIRHKIEFDTMMRLSPQGVSPFFNGFYSVEKLVKCDTTDLDPFDECNPVDCRLKYSGLRNYFNYKRKRCQKVPVCVGDVNKELPDVVYVPLSNTCKNLDKTVTNEDVAELLGNRFGKGKPDLESKMVNIQCHHGEIDVRTGLCICDKGWKSDIFDPDAYNEGTTVYHMCDKKCHPDVHTKFSATPFIIGIAFAFWILFIVFVCENCNFFCEFFKKDGKEEDEVCYYQVGASY